MLNQIADPNSTHGNSMLRLNETQDQLLSTLKIGRHIIGSLKQSAGFRSIDLSRHSPQNHKTKEHHD